MEIFNWIGIIVSGIIVSALTAYVYFYAYDYILNVKANNYRRKLREEQLVLEGEAREKARLARLPMLTFIVRDAHGNKHKVLGQAWHYIVEKNNSIVIKIISYKDDSFRYKIKSKDEVVLGNYTALFTNPLSITEGGSTVWKNS